LTPLTIAVSNGTGRGIEDEVFHQPDTDDFGGESVAPIVP
jgi:hypothetical protein